MIPKYKLSIFLLTLLFALPLPSCGKDPSVPTSLGTVTEPNEQDPSSPVILKESGDLGQSYLDSFIFLGESTTYHMKHRGVLSGGTETKQVWGPDNGTINLDSTITTLRIRYPDTGEYLTISEATERKKPEYIVLTFGLNGVVQNVKRGEEYYKSCYRTLLDTILTASPDTKIILQSCFPVASNMDMSHYSVSLEELNRLIEVINGWVLELAEEYDLRYLNTAEILKDTSGYLKMEYQSGDGHHLTRAAYTEILRYIRTHGYS